MSRFLLLVSIFVSSSSPVFILSLVDFSPSLLPPFLLLLLWVTTPRRLRSLRQSLRRPRLPLRHHHSRLVSLSRLLLLLLPCRLCCPPVQLLLLRLLFFARRPLLPLPLAAARGLRPSLKQWRFSSIICERLLSSRTSSNCLSLTSSTACFLSSLARWKRPLHSLRKTPFLEVPLLKRVDCKR